MNFSKSGIGFSFGGNGSRYTIGPDGRRTRTVGLPGTGIYYTKTLKSGNKPSNHNNSSSKIIINDEGKEIIINDETIRNYRDYINKIKNFHKNCTKQRDWNELANRISPLNEEGKGREEIAAQNILDSYDPSFIDKIFTENFEEKKKELISNVNSARLEDQSDFNVWKKEKSLAERIMNKDVDAYYEAINMYDPFCELSEYGTDIEFGTESGDELELEFSFKLKDIIPTSKLDYTPTGKISCKKMTKSEFFECGQDYVCSYAIRMARETFSLLPVNRVIVHASEKEEGTEASRTILSVLFNKEKFDETDFSEDIDASTYVESFEHNMSFSKTKGFKEVDKMEYIKDEDINDNFGKSEILNQIKELYHSIVKNSINDEETGWIFGKELELDFANYYLNLLYLFNALNNDNLKLIEFIQGEKLYDFKMIQDTEDFEKRVPFFISRGLEIYSKFGDIIDDSLKTGIDALIRFYEISGSTLISNSNSDEGLEPFKSYYKHIRHFEKIWNDYFSERGYEKKEPIGFSLKINGMNIEDFMKIYLDL